MVFRLKILVNLCDLGNYVTWEIYVTCKFIKFDIAEFYPSISGELLEKSINFARSIIEIKDKTIDIFNHARKSLLFHDGNTWVKKEGNPLFDVTMGSYNGAEVYVYYESCRTHWNLMNGEEFDSFKFLELKYRRVDQTIQLFRRIGSHQEIRYPFLTLRKFQKIDKSTGESCRNHWNLINGEEFESLKFLELKYRKGDQIIQLFYRIGSHQQIRSPSLIWRYFKKLRKILVNHVEPTEI